MVRALLFSLILLTVAYDAFSQENVVYYRQSSGFGGGGAGTRFGGYSSDVEHGTINRTIFGQLVGHDGVPLPDVYLSIACPKPISRACNHAITTDANGDFALTHPWSNKILLARATYPKSNYYSSGVQYLDDEYEIPIHANLVIKMNRYGEPLQLQQSLPSTPSKNQTKPLSFILTRNRESGFRTQRDLPSRPKGVAYKTELRGLYEGSYWLFAILGNDKHWPLREIKVPRDLGTHTFDLPSPVRPKWQVQQGQDIRPLTGERLRLRKDFYVADFYVFEEVLPGAYQISLDHPYLRPSGPTEVDRTGEARIPVHKRGSIEVELSSEIKRLILRHSPVAVRLRLTDLNRNRITDYRCEWQTNRSWVLKQLPPGAAKIHLFLLNSSRHASDPAENRIRCVWECTALVQPGITTRTLSWSESEIRAATEGLCATQPVEKIHAWEYAP